MFSDIQYNVNFLNSQIKNYNQLINYDCSFNVSDTESIISSDYLSENEDNTVDTFKLGSNRFPNQPLQIISVRQKSDESFKIEKKRVPMNDCSVIYDEKVELSGEVSDVCSEDNGAQFIELIKEVSVGSREALTHDNYKLPKVDRFQLNGTLCGNRIDAISQQSISEKQQRILQKSDKSVGTNSGEEMHRNLSPNKETLHKSLMNDVDTQEPGAVLQDISGVSVDLLSDYIDGVKSLEQVIRLSKRKKAKSNKNQKKPKQRTTKTTQKLSKDVCGSSNTIDNNREQNNASENCGSSIAEEPKSVPSLETVDKRDILDNDIGKEDFAEEVVEALSNGDFSCAYVNERGDILYEEDIIENTKVNSSTGTECNFLDINEDSDDLKITVNEANYELKNNENVQDSNVLKGVQDALKKPNEQKANKERDGKKRQKKSNITEIVPNTDDREAKMLSKSKELQTRAEINLEMFIKTNLETPVDDQINEPMQNIAAGKTDTVQSSDSGYNEPDNSKEDMSDPHLHSILDLSQYRFRFIHPSFHNNTASSVNCYLITSSDMEPIEFGPIISGRTLDDTQFSITRRDVPFSEESDSDHNTRIKLNNEQIKVNDNFEKRPNMELGKVEDKVKNSPGKDFKEARKTKEGTSNLVIDSKAFNYEEENILHDSVPLDNETKIEFSYKKEKNIPEISLDKNKDDRYLDQDVTEFSEELIRKDKHTDDWLVSVSEVYTSKSTSLQTKASFFNDDLIYDPEFKCGFKNLDEEQLKNSIRSCEKESKSSIDSSHSSPPTHCTAPVSLPQRDLLAEVAAEKHVCLSNPKYAPFCVDYTDSSCCISSHEEIAQFLSFQWLKFCEKMIISQILANKH